MWLENRSELYDRTGSETVGFKQYAIVCPFVYRLVADTFDQYLP